jgi:hypothetical protein
LQGIRFRRAGPGNGMAVSAGKRVLLSPRIVPLGDDFFEAMD